MALSSSVNFQIQETDAKLIAAISLTSDWQTMIAANDGSDGGPESADAATITNPTTQITKATRRIYLRQGKAGMFLVLRLGYDDALTVTVDPVVAVFGRKNSSGKWERLRNRAGALTGTLATDITNDVTDGTLKYTTVHHDNNMWDVLGCNEILVGVQTALAGTGTTTNSIVEGKVI